MIIIMNSSLEKYNYKSVKVLWWSENRSCYVSYMTCGQNTSTFHRNTWANHPPISVTVYTAEGKALFLHNHSSVLSNTSKTLFLELDLHLIRLNALYKLLSMKPWCCWDTFMRSLNSTLVICGICGKPRLRLFGGFQGQCLVVYRIYFCHYNDSFVVILCTNGNHIFSLW